jgi:hypothetical protein
MIREYIRLHQWRRHMKPVVEAVCEVVPGGVAYLAGGAAEGRLTALSDIDVVVVVPYHLVPIGRIEIKLKILDRAFEKGLPIDYPIDLHVVDEAGLERYKKLGKLVELARCPEESR